MDIHITLHVCLLDRYLAIKSGKNYIKTFTHFLPFNLHRFIYFMDSGFKKKIPVSGQPFIHIQKLYNFYSTAKSCSVP
jgi:hypothetical protein